MDNNERFKLFSQFSPFDQVDQRLFEEIVMHIAVRSAKQGQALFTVGDYDADEYYLLVGKVSLEAKDGRVQHLSAGDSKAQLPLARLRPRMYTAKAATDIKYFSVSKSVMDELQKSIQRSDSNVLVDEMRHQAGEDGRILLHEFEQELKTGRFSLPSLPETALKIREKADNPECNLADLAAVINTDPAIVIKLIRTANSPLYRGVSPCKDTLAAISRLGLTTTKQLVTSFAVLSLFKSDSAAITQQMKVFWQQSVDVAAFSFVLAKQLPTLNEDEAMLAGVLHCIGSMAILSFAEHFYDLSTDQLHLESVISLLRGKIGGMVLEKWDFSPELVTVARDYDNWDRPNRDNTEIDYCDLVQVASLYAAQYHNTFADAPEVHTIPAFDKIALTQEQTEQIFLDAEEQLAEIKALLNGGH